MLAILSIAWGLFTPSAQAADGPQEKPSVPAALRGISSPFAAQDDGGAYEVGVHHTGVSSGSNAGEPHFNADGWGAYYRLGLCGFNQRYRYGNTYAWEEDFKRNDLGGTNGSYIDSVDLQYYTGHGWPGGFTFANSSHDDGSIVPADCYRAWGDNDNEWLAMTSCQVLEDSNLSPMAQCMYGQHLILGFKTLAWLYTSSEYTQGYNFGKYVCQGYSMAQAWYKACDRTQPQGTIARVLMNELPCLNDNVWGTVCADSFDWDAWYQTHACGSETARQVNLAVLQGEMPVYRVQPLSLDEATDRFGDLQAVFNVTGTISSTVAAAMTPLQNDPFFTSQSGERELEMDKQGGLFGYYDLGQLWTQQQAEQALLVNAASVDYIDQNDARGIADSFLQRNGLNGAGSQFYHVISDTLSSSMNLTTTVDASQSVTDTETAVVWQVLYSRILAYTPTVSVAGVTAPTVNFSVVGPGAKQKVYVPTSSVVSASSALQENVVGVQAGWRSIEQPVNAATGEAMMVSILPESQVRDLYLAAGKLVALNDVPFTITGTAQIISSTVAYWEEAAGVGQAELVPVYSLNVRLQDANTGALTDNFIYVPASPIYMRPYAEILEKPATSVDAGTTITLKAEDASKTLTQLGFAGFDFALGSGSDTDYQYAWYVNEITDANRITTGLTDGGKTLALKLPDRFDDRSEGTKITIHLKVTDLGNPNQSSANTSVTIDVNPRVFLPSISK